MWPCLGLVACLVLLVRPIVAFTATLGAGLTRNERIFIGAMDPRGIVAASTAASFSAALVALGIGGADRLLPATFLVIVGTVTIYGLAATPLAGALGLREPEPEPGPGPRRRTVNMVGPMCVRLDVSGSGDRRCGLDACDVPAVGRQCPHHKYRGKDDQDRPQGVPGQPREADKCRQQRHDHANRPSPNFAAEEREPSQ